MDTVMLLFVAEYVCLVVIFTDRCTADSGRRLFFVTLL